MPVGAAPRRAANRATRCGGVAMLPVSVGARGRTLVASCRGVTTAGRANDKGPHRSLTTLARAASIAIALAPAAGCGSFLDLDWTPATGAGGGDGEAAS